MVQRTVCHRVLADDGGQIFCKHFHGCPKRECERLVPSRRKHSGELWIDPDGTANFIFHIESGDFLDAQQALRKFINCLQQKLDNAKKCPAYEPEQNQIYSRLPWRLERDERRRNRDRCRRWQPGPDIQLSGHPARDAGGIARTAHRRSASQLPSDSKEGEQ